MSNFNFLTNAGRAIYSFFRPKFRSVFMITILSCFVTSSLPAFAYELEDCSQNSQKKTFIALGLHVFGLQNGNFEIITMEDDSHNATLPLPPKSSDAVGCFGNPMHALSSRNVKFSAAASDDHDLAFKHILDETSVALYHQPATPEFTYQAEFDRVCSQFKNEAIIAPNIMGCWQARNKGEKFDGSQRILLQVNSNASSSTPSGQTLMLECTGGACDARYGLYDDVLVTYHFKLADLPFDKIANFDQALRRRIIAAEISGYPWAAQTNSSK